MKTTHKIAAARAIYQIVHAGRSLMGRTDSQVVTRDSVIYDLDLAQGIDFAIYLGIYERGTRAALRKLVKRDALVLDIGANIGAHTLTLADLVGPAGKVLAFEPTHHALTKIQRKLALNPEHPPRVKAQQCFFTRVGGQPPAATPYLNSPPVPEPGA